MNDRSNRLDGDARDVLRLRCWFHLLNEMLKRKEFRIPVHLAFGYEAIAVAVDRTMDKGDVLCVAHRNIEYNLIRSKDFKRVLRHFRLELATEAGGKMGSMNLAMEQTGIAYASSILGNNLPVAAGIALNRVVQGREGVVFVVTGDGAMEEGAFWETLVFARSHGLRLVVIVENNDYAMSSTIAERRAPIDLAKVCAGLDVDYRNCHGGRVADVREILAAAKASAGSGRPQCVEISLTALNQHAGPTPGWPDDPMRISMENGLVVRADRGDPVFVLKQEIGATEFEALEQQVLLECRHGV